MDVISVELPLVGHVIWLVTGHRNQRYTNVDIRNVPDWPYQKEFMSHMGFLGNAMNHRTHRTSSFLADHAI